MNMQLSVSCNVDDLVDSIGNSKLPQESILRIITQLDKQEEDWEFTYKLAKYFIGELAKEKEFLVDCGYDLSFINFEGM